MTCARMAYGLQTLAAWALGERKKERGESFPTINRQDLNRCITCARQWLGEQRDRPVDERQCTNTACTSPDGLDVPEGMSQWVCVNCLHPASVRSLALAAKAYRAEHHDDGSAIVQSHFTFRCTNCTLRDGTSGMVKRINVEMALTFVHLFVDTCRRQGVLCMQELPSN